jgi:hypothetical protein
MPSLLRKLKVLRRRRRLAVYNQHHTRWDLPNGGDELRSIIDSGEIALVREPVVRDADSY